jgi:hypothetical protein
MLKMQILVQLLFIIMMIPLSQWVHMEEVKSIIDFFEFYFVYIRYTNSININNTN